MKLDRKELENYPDTMNKEQLRKVGHMSKRTALYLLQSKLIPSEYNGGKSWCYKIKKKDIIRFFDRLEKSSNQYIAPPSWYSSKQKVKPSPYVIRCMPEEPLTEEALRALYTKKLRKYGDVLSVTEVSNFTGYRSTTVTGWIRDKKLVGLPLGRGYIIPKTKLIDWLSSDAYNSIERKSKKHVYSLWWSNEAKIKSEDS